MENDHLRLGQEPDHASDCDRHVEQSKACSWRSDAAVDVSVVRFVDGSKAYLGGREGRDGRDCRDGRDARIIVAFEVEVCCSHCQLRAPCCKVRSGWTYLTGVSTSAIVMSSSGGEAVL